MKTATYYGKRVEVTEVRDVAGGQAADVRRHPEEQDWPWTVESFTVALEQLKDRHLADMDDCITLEEQYGCDPWDDEHYGKHPASREPNPNRVVHGRRW